MVVVIIVYNIYNMKFYNTMDIINKNNNYIVSEDIIYDYYFNYYHLEIKIINILIFIITIL